VVVAIDVAGPGHRLARPGVQTGVPDKPEGVPRKR
jgi:hypothetical protein